MKYFLHDTNSFNDEKVSELFIKHGYEGIGLFYSILEKLASQEKPIKTKVLKAQLKVGKKLDKCWAFMETLGIISANNGETFNERILSYSEKYKIKNEKNAKRVSDWRENQLLTENVTHTELLRNTDVMLSKQSKVKVIEINSKQAEVFEYLRFSTPNNITDVQLHFEARELLKTYEGKEIKNLRGLCTSWANNIRPVNDGTKKLVL